MRYFFHIGYNGSQYRGWQRQKNVVTIQEVFEQNLCSLLKKKVHCSGCGRTDAGVHAIQYFFHIDTPSVLTPNFIFILNKMLPKDIAVYDIIPVEGTPHAQFSAVERTYIYYIHNAKNPFISDLSSFYILENLDIDKMKLAVSLLSKYSDFRNFCKTPDRHDNTICNVKSASLIISSDNKLQFQITADKFLKNMIRIIVNRLIEIGEGKLSITQFENFLSLKEIPRYFKLAYPQGLYLLKVVYPFLEINPRSEMIFSV